MPYIALQLVGIQAVLQSMGLAGTGWQKDLPLIIAFAILAAYTYTSGLRAPARWTLALGSAFALFMYPHSITGCSRPASAT